HHEAGRRCRGHGPHPHGGRHDARRRDRRAAARRRASARGRGERRAHHALHGHAGHHRGTPCEGPVDPVNVAGAEHRVPITRLTAEGVLPRPAERIAEDVRAFTATTLSFVLMLCNATVTVLAFSGVLWSISRTLFAVAVLYAACGSALTVLFGRPLVWLNYNQ